MVYLRPKTRSEKIRRKTLYLPGQVVLYFIIKVLLMLYVDRI